MSHRSLRPLFAFGLAAILLGYAGCSNAPDSVVDPRAKTTKETETTPLKTPPPEKSSHVETLYANWPTPAAALVISGEQFGYLEPCGCTEGQQGGLLRRANMLEKLRDEQKWPLALADLGSLVKSPSLARGGPEQIKLKFRASLQALSTLKYNALALSPEDLKLGIDETVGQFLNMPDGPLKVVAANVAAAGLDSKIAPSVRTKAGPVAIGITAVVDPEWFKALKDPSDLLAVKPIDETLPAVLKDLESDTQTQVLLVQGSRELAKELAAKYPGFDVVVSTSEFPDPEEAPESANGGKTMIVSIGHKGKYVGVVGIFDKAEPRYRYQRVALNTRFDGPATAMKAVIEGEFRDSLKAQGIVENFLRHDFVNGASNSKYVGAESCKTCHPNTYAKWAGTKHAAAYTALEKDPKPNVVYDAECIKCHTTGFEYTSGWKSAESTPYLKGNQCENCHGPASRHITDPANLEIRGFLHLTAERADKSRLCISCHDEDNSHNFKFETHWPQITHTGLDKPKAKPAAAGKGH